MKKISKCCNTPTLLSEGDYFCNECCMICEVIDSFSTGTGTTIDTFDTIDKNELEYKIIDCDFWEIKKIISNEIKEGWEFIQYIKKDYDDQNNIIIFKKI